MIFTKVRLHSGWSDLITTRPTKRCGSFMAILYPRLEHSKLIASFPGSHALERKH